MFIDLNGVFTNRFTFWRSTLDKKNVNKQNSFEAYAFQVSYEKKTLRHNMVQ